MTEREVRSAVAAVVAGVDRADRDLLELLGDESHRSDLLDALAAAAPGSSRALEVLLTAVHRERLAAGAIHRVIVDHHDAEEIEQDVLIALARSIGSFRGDARFTTWLHTVARNVAVDFLRRRRELAVLDDGDRIELTASGRLSSMIATRATVRAAVDELPEMYRAAVTLRDVEHLSYQEVADRLGLNLNTTRSRIARGRALLAGDLGPELDPSGSGAELRG